MQWFLVKWLAIPTDGRQWTSICGYVWHEVCKVLHKSQEALHILMITGCAPLMYVCHLIRICMHTLVIHLVPQAVYAA